MTEQNRKRNARTMTWVALVVTALLAWQLYRVHEGSGWLAVVSSLSFSLTAIVCWIRVAQLRRWI